MRLPISVRLLGLLARLAPRRYRRKLRQAIRRRVAPELLSMVLEGTTRFVRMPIDCTVLVYFGDPPRNLYQLTQWLPALEELHRSHPVIILTRRGDTFRRLRDRTVLPLACIRSFAELDPFYTLNAFKVCIYVNNSGVNFHSLMYPDLLHVHVNHGESDKVSMASNQAKAYDLVYVAGRAAVERYRANLINFDERKLRVVGRPQLDTRYDPYPWPSARPTVVYAPTWEGGRSEMDYSSVAALGVELVRGLLSSGWFRVVYRPHPKLGINRRDIAHADRDIVAEMEAAAKREPDVGHRVDREAPAGQLYEAADVLVTDVSSVALDFLATGKPLFMTDPKNDRERLHAAAPVSEAAYIVDAASAGALAADIHEILAADPRAAERQRMIEWYFGDVTDGVATKRFIEAVDEAITMRDAMIAEKRRSR